MDYDKIASKYNDGYSGYFFSQEDEGVKKLIGYEGGSVLDVGCGTGLTVSLLGVDKENYFGLDVSKKILDIMNSNFPGYETVNAKITDIVLEKRYSIAVALYGVMNYLTREEIIKIQESADRFFLMDYRDGYHPVCYPNNEFPKRAFAKQNFSRFYRGKFNNYDIYEGRANT